MSLEARGGVFAAWRITEAKVRISPGGRVPWVDSFVRRRVSPRLRARAPLSEQIGELTRRCLRHLFAVSSSSFDAKDRGQRVGLVHGRLRVPVNQIGRGRAVRGGQIPSVYFSHGCRDGDFGADLARPGAAGAARAREYHRCALARPRCLLMDEPSHRACTKAVPRSPKPIRVLQQQHGMSILLIEQNVREALRISDRAVVMKAGAIILEASPGELKDNARLMELY
jgi:hypothetical protein